MFNADNSTLTTKHSTEPPPTGGSWFSLVVIIIQFWGIMFGIQPVPYMLAIEYFPTYLRPKV